MKNLKLVMLGMYALSMVGCAMAQTPVNGLFYTDDKSPGGATEAYGGTARGESCATSILGAYASGDASIDAAKKDGGIAQVTVVDHTAKSILGFYAKYCTIVYGKKAAGGGAANGSGPGPKPPK